MYKRICIMLVLGMLSIPCLSAESKVSYTVSEILKIRSLTEFECRLEGYAYAPSARFRVKIRDVVANPKLPAEEAAEYLSERLRNAEQIVLQKIQFRNYFRIMADVYVDGRNIRDELIELNLALSDELLKENEAIASRTATQSQSQRRYRPPIERVSDKSRATLTRRRVNIRTLMESEVDLSVIDDETTLEEALQIISESVQPRIPFVVLWSDLQSNALVEKDTPIGVSEFGRVKLKQALKIIFHSLSLSAPSKVILAIEGGVVTVGTERGLIQKATVHAYSVTDLMNIPFAEEIATQGGFSGR